ncbi:hypothetical protein [Streptomyces sp. NPDC007988]
MMSRDPDQPPDPAASVVLLATEAALLEARLGMLREALDTVDARIEAVSDTLRRLRHATSCAGAADGRHGRTSGGDGAAPRPHDT